MLNISAHMMYLQDTRATVRVRAPLNLSVDTTITTSSQRISKSDFMSGTLAEYKTSFHRSYPCVVFLSAEKPMRVVDSKRITTTKVKKVTSFSSLTLESINTGHLVVKNLCKPTRNRYEYDEYVKKLFDIIQENCYFTYVKQICIYVKYIS